MTFDGSVTATTVGYKSPLRCSLKQATTHLVTAITTPTIGPSTSKKTATPERSSEPITSKTICLRPTMTNPIALFVNYLTGSPANDCNSIGRLQQPQPGDTLNSPANIRHLAGRHWKSLPSTVPTVEPCNTGEATGCEPHSYRTPPLTPCPNPRDYRACGRATSARQREVNRSNPTNHIELPQR